MNHLIRERLYSRSRAGVKFALGAGALIFGLALDASAQEPTTWSVPVRVLSAAPSTVDAASTDMARQAPAVSSTGLPPQYQTTKRTRAASGPQIIEAPLRFILPLIEQPILVEARVTVNGKPFRELREERIDKLLQELAEPAPIPAASPVETATDIAEETDAAPTVETESPPKPTVDNSFLARLRRYAEATKRVPSRDEVQWLLTNWADGPTLLLLDENYQRVRANASPLFTILDRDEDGVLSSAEISSAQETLWRYDGNQDEVLSLDEINKAAERTPDTIEATPTTAPLIPLEQLGSSQTFRRLCEFYRDALSRLDGDGDGSFSETELTELRAAQPDLIVLVAFDTHDASRSRLEVIPNVPSFGDSTPTARGPSLTFLSGGTLLEFSAIQSQNMADADQVSLGAIRDGFPLLPEIDANEDGRLTVRELRQVSMSLATFDRDRDGSVSKAELPPTLRVSFGLGPIVHRHLASVRSLHPAVPTPGIAPPEWFARMDRNRDGDLTPREFLGGKEQFASLDTDEDGLISIAEANASQE